MALLHAVVVAAGLGVAPLAAAELGLPSGLRVVLHEIVWDEAGRSGRFRFVAPEVGEAGFDPSVLEGDLLALCTGFAWPVQQALQPGWDEIVLSVAAAPLPLGAMDANVAQFFEGFSMSPEGCIWDVF